MPRPSEIQAEEAIPTKSPLRRSTRIVSVNSPAPSEIQAVIRGRRLSTTSVDGSEEVNSEAKTTRTTRASSITKENCDLKPDSAKVKGEKSATIVASAKEDDKKSVSTRGRRSSITVEETETKPRTRRASVTADDEKKTAKGKSLVQAEKEIEERKKPVTRRRSSVQEDNDEDKKPIKERRRSIQEVPEELPLRSTRSRRSASRDLFDDNDEPKQVKNSENEIPEKRTRSRRTSTEVMEETDNQKPLVKTPVKRKRRLSSAESSVVLEPINEKEHENESPKHVSDKTKQEQSEKKSNLNLSIIKESSFSEELEANHSRSRLSLDKNVPKENFEEEDMKVNEKTSLEASEKVSSVSQVSPNLANVLKVEDSKEYPIKKKEKGEDPPASKLSPRKLEIVLKDVKDVKNTTEKVSAQKLSPSIPLVLDRQTDNKNTEASTPKAVNTSLKASSVINKLEDKQGSPDSPVRRSPRLLEKCKSGELHTHKKCNCEDSSPDRINSKKIDFQLAEKSDEIESLNFAESVKKEHLPVTEKIDARENRKSAEPVDKDSHELTKTQEIDHKKESETPRKGTKISEEIDDAFLSDTKIEFESTEADKTNLNDSKTSENSDKENLSENVSSVTKDIAAKNTLLEDVTFAPNKQSTILRTSNIFKPKNIDYSYNEPMELDTTVEISRCDKSFFTRTLLNLTANETVDETFSLNLSVTHLESPKEEELDKDKKKLEDIQFDSQENIKIKAIKKGTNVENEANDSSQNTFITNSDNKTSHINSGTEELHLLSKETVKEYSLGLPDGNRPKPTSQLKNKDSDIEDDGDKETKGISDDYEFEIPSEEEADRDHEKKCIKENGINDTPNKVERTPNDHSSKIETSEITTSKNITNKVAEQQDNHETFKNILHADDAPKIVENKSKEENIPGKTEIGVQESCPEISENISNSNVITSADSIDVDKIDEMEKSFKDIIKEDEESSDVAQDRNISKSGHNNPEEKSVDSVIEKEEKSTNSKSVEDAIEQKDASPPTNKKCKRISKCADDTSQENKEDLISAEKLQLENSLKRDSIINVDKLDEMGESFKDIVKEDVEQDSNISKSGHCNPEENSVDSVSERKEETLTVKKLKRKSTGSKSMENAIEQKDASPNKKSKRKSKCADENDTEEKLQPENQDEFKTTNRGEHNMAEKSVDGAIERNEEKSMVKKLNRKSTDSTRKSKSFSLSEWFEEDITDQNGDVFEKETEIRNVENFEDKTDTVLLKNKIPKRKNKKTSLDLSALEAIDQDKTNLSKMSFEEIDDIANSNELHITKRDKKGKQRISLNKQEISKNENDSVENTLDTAKKARGSFEVEQEAKNVKNNTELDTSLTKKKQKRNTSFDSVVDQKPKESLEDFANSKLDEYLKRKLIDFEEQDLSDSDDESELSNSLICDMAEEGEEDTPSDDSNEIVDEGESIYTDSEISEDNSDDDDSFICDEEHFELLPGDEYDLDMDKEKRKSRILDVENRDEDVIKIEKKPKPELPKRRSRIVKVSESSSDEDIECLDSMNSKADSSSIIKKPEENDDQGRSTIKIIENIDVHEIKDSALTDRINQIVGAFCTTIPHKVTSLNLSLEYAENASPVSKGTSKKKSTSFSPKELNQSNSLMEYSFSKIQEAIETVKRKSTSAEECESSSKEPRMSESFTKTEKLNHKRLSKSMDEIERKKRKKNKKNTQKQRNGNSFTRGSSSENLKSQTFGLMNQLLNDVKNRPKRQITPSSTKLNGLNSTWIVEDQAEMRPSTSIVSKQEIDDFKKNKFHPKDFRSQMLYDSSRVRREDTKKLLRKKGAYY